MGSLCDEALPLMLSYGVTGPNISETVFRHWCGQPAVPWEAHCVVGFLLVFICVFSVAGNLLVVVVFTRYRRLRSPANTLIVNLAASDLFNGLLHPMAAYSSFRGVWSFGRAGCEVYAALCGLFGLVSIVTLTAIALERCLVISVKPWQGSVLFTHSKAKGAIGAVWIYCLSLVMPPLTVGWGAFVPEGFLTSCSFDYLSRNTSNRAYFLFLFFFGFFLPVFIIGICYTFILQTIFQNERDMKMNNVTKVNQSKVKKSEYRAAEMILMVIALFLISWTPYSLIACLGQFGDRGLLTPWVSVLPSLFAKMSTLYNPAIYGLSHRHFRATLKRICKRDSRRNKSGTNISKNSSISRSRMGCPCLPTQGAASDTLDDSSVSLTGKNIYMDKNNSEKREKLCLCGAQPQRFPLENKFVPKARIRHIPVSSSYASQYTLHEDNIAKLPKFRGKQKAKKYSHDTKDKNAMRNPDTCEYPTPISCQSGNEFVKNHVNKHGTSIENNCCTHNQGEEASESLLCNQRIPYIPPISEAEDVIYRNSAIEQKSYDSMLCSVCFHSALRSFPENSCSHVSYKIIPDDSLRIEAMPEREGISHKQNFRICVLGIKYACETGQQPAADLSSSAEELSECAAHFKGKTKDHFSGQQCPNGLIRNLMFRSEQSLHQKYLILLERDHIVKVPTVV